MWNVTSVTSALSSDRTASQTWASSALTAGMELVVGMGLRQPSGQLLQGPIAGGEAARGVRGGCLSGGSITLARETVLRPSRRAWEPVRKSREKPAEPSREG